MTKTSRENAGAIRLREVHGDWTLTTTPQPARVLDDACSIISQVQLDEETRRRLLVIELRPGRERVAGALLLPSGLSQDQGVVLQFEESAPSSRQALIVQSKGYLVDLDFDEATVAKLTSSRCLHVTAGTDTGDEINFSIPLNGFASALARARLIGK